MLRKNDAAGDGRSPGSRREISANVSGNSSASVVADVAPVPDRTVADERTPSVNDVSSATSAPERLELAAQKRNPSGSPGHRTLTGQSVTYRYVALRPDGGFENGVLEAAGREAAAEVLAGRGVFPIEVRPEAVAERAGRVTTADLALGLRALGTLLGAQLSMRRALGALEELVPPSWRQALPAIQEAVREGRSLANALAGAGLGLPPIAKGIIEAGEAAGALGPAVRRAAEVLESSDALRSAIRGALAYPLILAGAGVASIALLVGVVLPRFEAILRDLGQAVPATTRLVLAVAEAARIVAVPGVLAIILVAIAWRVWTGTIAGREKWHAFLLALPKLGAVRRSGATARVTAALAALLERGVPVPAAISVAAQTGGDAALSSRLAATREAVVGGERLSTALSATDALTPTAARLMRAGEDSGSLVEVLEHIARIEAERTERQVRAAVRLIEPALILLFAGLVALAAAALLQAVYSVSPAP